MPSAESCSGVLGLMSAFVWGAGDFFGGYSSRKANVSGVVAFSQSIGLFPLVLAAVIVGEAFLKPRDLLWSAAAGVMSGLGVITYYAVLSRGSMAYAAPVTGLVSTSVPALTGSFIEGLPKASQAVGFVLALVSIALVTGATKTSFKLSPRFVLAAFAGICFGSFLVFLGQVSEGSVLFPLAVSRLVTVAMAAVLVKGLTDWKRVAKAYPYVTAAGLFDTGGSFLFLLARQLGRLDVAGVLSSLYPISTIILAKTILNEPIGKKRATGIITAAAATITINI
ncbi:MAG: EamA family transporter [Candidatus Caldarchaeum sp.]|nr:EamA family transporter [Candidatus Caldarchaeum sp.]